MHSEDDVQLIRHTVATVAYRAAKMLRDAPEGFAGVQAGPTTRTAQQIVAHMGDLFLWASALADGAKPQIVQAERSWDEEVERFFAALKAFDDRLTTGRTLHTPAERLFQGPISDSLTHIGQLATLRRLTGAPVPHENYFAAPVEIGRISMDPPAPLIQ